MSFFKTKWLRLMVWFRYIILPLFKKEKDEEESI